MMFRITHKEAREKEQAWCKANYNVWYRKFAWFPTELRDGRLVWLDWYEYEHFIVIHYGTYCLLNLNYKKRAIESTN